VEINKNRKNLLKAEKKIESLMKKPPGDEEIKNSVMEASANAR